MKIIVTEKISDKGVALLQAVPDFDYLFSVYLP